MKNVQKLVDMLIKGTDMDKINWIGRWDIVLIHYSSVEFDDFKLFVDLSRNYHKLYFRDKGLNDNIKILSKLRQSIERQEKRNLDASVISACDFLISKQILDGS